MHSAALVTKSFGYREELTGLTGGMYNLSVTLLLFSFPSLLISGEKWKFRASTGIYRLLRTGRRLLVSILVKNVTRIVTPEKAS